MPTATEALVIAAASLDAATQSVLQTRAQIQADFAQARADSTKIVSDAIALQKGWIVDPVNGNDNNEGSTLAKAKKTMRGVLSVAAPSTDHFVYLMNDLYEEYYSQCFANIVIRGSTNAPDPSGTFPYAAAKRKLTFRPTALNSPLGFSTTVPAGFQLLHSMRFSGVDIVLADQPAGQTQPGHFYAFNQSALIVDGGDILGVTAGAPGRLLVKGDSAPAGFYLYGSVAPAAQGRIFHGIAAGADPRAAGNFVTNLTTN